MGRTNATSPDERTPLAGLVEVGMHNIVGYQLAQASIVTTQVFAAAVGSPFELRPVEFTVLTLINENPDVTARQLAKALAVTPPNIALWIDRLERRKLITRTRSQTDARSQHIRTTAAGSSLAKNAVQRLIDGERDALRPLSAAERAMLVELLHKVALARKKSAVKVRQGAPIAAARLAR